MPVTYYVALPFVRNEEGELLLREAQDRQSVSAAESHARRLAETAAGASPSRGRASFRPSDNRGLRFASHGLVQPFPCSLMR